MTRLAARSVFALLALAACSSSRGRGGDPGDPDASADGGDPGDGGGGGGGIIPDDDPVPQCDEGGHTFFYVVHRLDVGTNAWVKANVDPDAPTNVVPGLNLDKVDNSEDFVGVSKSPCGKRQDYVYASTTDPTHVGIDNRTAAFLTDATALADIDISAEIKDAIMRGDLLLLVRVKNVDADLQDPDNEAYFPDDDGCVNVDILLGTPPPNAELMFDGSNELTAGQMFDVLANSYEKEGEAVVQVRGARIKDSRLTGGTSTKLPIELPVSETETLDLAIENAKVEFNITATEITSGVLGGTLDVNDTATQLAAYLGASEELKGVVRALVAGHADINPNLTGTVCSDISMGLVYSARPALDTGMVR